MQLFIIRPLCLNHFNKAVAFPLAHKGTGAEIPLLCSVALKTETY
jgi:hypothetical protein